LTRIKLIHPGERKINVIKLICDHTIHDLKEASNLVNQIPVEITKINPGEEDKLLEKLLALGNGCRAETFKLKPLTKI
jgi:ribosomal protein L7/L12